MARHERTLTRREREVVRLIAAGLTGRQVAERLGIGAAMVRAHTHLARMKLGVGAGVRFARWLAERGGSSQVDGPPNRGGSSGEQLDSVRPVHRSRRVGRDGGSGAEVAWLPKPFDSGLFPKTVDRLAG
jgi:DNA-binding CsgD family transcriptional regulator